MTPTIEAHGAQKRYGKTQALDGLDLVAERGPGRRPARARTAPARPRSCARSPRCSGPTPARCASPATTSRASPTRSAASIGLAGQYAAVEPAMTGRENLEMVARLFGHDRRAARAPRPTPCSSSSASARPPTAWCARTRAACAAGSTSAPAWSAPRGCCCSTSPPPASTRAAASSCGTRSATSSTPGTDVLLTTQYLDEADQLAEPDRDHRPRPRRSPTGTPAELKRRVGGNVIEVHARDATTCARGRRALAALGRRRRRRSTRRPGG